MIDPAEAAKIATNNIMNCNDMLKDLTLTETENVHIDEIFKTMRKMGKRSGQHYDQIHKIGGLSE